jgi:hypothetical protein
MASATLASRVDQMLDNRAERSDRSGVHLPSGHMSAKAQLSGVSSPFFAALGTALVSRHEIAP